MTTPCPTCGRDSAPITDASLEYPIAPGMAYIRPDDRYCLPPDDYRACHACMIVFPESSYTRPVADYRFTIPLCPTCGQPADALKEIVPAWAGLTHLDGDRYAYDGNGSEIVWDGQVPELTGDPPVALLQCENAHTWETGIQCDGPCTAGLMPGESCERCGLRCTDDTDDEVVPRDDPHAERNPSPDPERLAVEGMDQHELDADFLAARDLARATLRGWSPEDYRALIPYREWDQT